MYIMCVKCALYTHTHTYTQETNGWKCTPWCTGVAVQESARLSPTSSLPSPAAMWEGSGVQGRGLCLENPGRQIIPAQLRRRKQFIIYPFCPIYFHLRWNEISPGKGAFCSQTAPPRRGPVIGFETLHSEPECALQPSVPLRVGCVKWRLVMLSLPWESLWYLYVSVASRKPCLPKWEESTRKHKGLKSC